MTNTSQKDGLPPQMREALRKARDCALSHLGLLTIDNMADGVEETRALIAELDAALLAQDGAGEWDIPASAWREGLVAFINHHNIRTGMAVEQASIHAEAQARSMEMHWRATHPLAAAPPAGGRVMGDFDTKYTDNPVCPYCGSVERRCVGNQFRRLHGRRHHPAAEGDALCSDCPPAGDGDTCRCDPCPRRTTPPQAGQAEQAISPKRFRKRPVVIEAVQWTGNNLAEVLGFTGKHPSWGQWFSSFEEYEARVRDDGGLFKIMTMEGTMSAGPGDWIIRGVQGEHYPCKPEIFDATYEAEALATRADAPRYGHDAKALEVAQRIALMWGEDRSQFVAKIQVAVLEAMQFAAPSLDGITTQGGEVAGWMWEERGYDDSWKWQWDKEVPQYQDQEKWVRNARPLYATPPVPVAQGMEAVEMSPEFTDTSRAALAWVLYHHQGGSSPVGLPIRFALGMGDHERLSDYQISEARRWAKLTSSRTANFHTAPPAPSSSAVEGLVGEWRKEAKGETTTAYEEGRVNEKLRCAYRLEQALASTAASGGDDSPRDISWWARRLKEQEAITDHLADQLKSAAPAMPEGFVMVPRVPTPKMIDATFNDAIETSGQPESHNTRNHRIYAAMIAAAGDGS
jgi:hypothetical protein